MRLAVAHQSRVVAALGRRALSVQFRRAQLLMPTFVLPLMLLAIIASGTSAALDLPEFPSVSSYLTFVVPGTLIQGALLAGLTTGIALASDIEFGFFDRLLASPASRTSLVLGRLAGTCGLAVLQSCFFLAVAMLFGAQYDGGAGAVLAAIALTVLTATALGGIAAALAFVTGSLSMMQSIFPFVFMLLFTAPAFFPRDLLAPALQTVATYNPLTYVIEGIRALLTGDHDLGDPLLGLAAAAGMFIAGVAVATYALRRRLGST